ncbi:MAG TPA: DUF4258 domain-containing protein [Chitinophagaceae bacterium]|jgi:hypothetical protein|nr:DUF4258 domain-containing protein [Chitinophagaceae bacterium]
MKAKLYVFLLVCVMLVVALWLVNRDKPPVKPAVVKRSPTRVNRRNEEAPKRGFDRKVSKLEYTAHAKCRMKCRRITQQEIKDIMKNGNINYTKSDLNDRPCPTYALEGYTVQDKQHVRVVFAQCSEKTKVVTCIDLENEFSCDCK